MCYLRDQIPDFDKRCRNFWMAWKKMMEQRTVTRMGYTRMRFFKDDTIGMFLPDDVPFNDAEHVFGMVNAIILFRDFFGKYIPYLFEFQPDWLEYIEQAVFHEIGEITIGDWVDDGSNDRDKKDHLEQAAFDAFMHYFPETAQEKHQRQFADLRDGRTNMKLFDKEAFLLGIAYYKSKGISGNLKDKDGITEQDRSSCEEIQSYRSFDNVFAGILRKYRRHSFLPFIVGINEAIYAIEYNEDDPLVTNCTPGKPPPGVRNLY